MKKVRVNDGHKKGGEGNYDDDSYGEEEEDVLKRKQELEEVSLKY